ncbi:TPA: hypothetical protein VNE79_001603 [Streptococcus pyogenes]|nr:hypothetical protein [Streptococcus pyogenes]HES3538828.1 hypothetical protein [Streptococcus pyogenes]HES3540501.1 hypothetical protein [Streptococcus pyogenes]HES4832333.1 hypothetical protein [Streptococcus pyogenes]HES5445389.1 hypothetical protein [Streptococcus pyogenes]
MSDIGVYSVLVSRIEYSDGTGSKVRPAVVVKFNDEVIKTLRLTTKYENKSDNIKSQYLEVIDWAKANLKRRSWIDTIQYYDLEDKGFNIKIIGKLSDRDIERLKDFLRAKEV